MRARSPPPLNDVMLTLRSPAFVRSCVFPVFIDVFEKFGVPITMEEARGPMGQQNKQQRA